MSESNLPEEPESALGQPYPWTTPGILVGVDGSESSRAALRYAADLAPKLGLPLHALVVWDYPALAWGDWYVPETIARLEEAADAVAEAEAAKLFPDGRPDWFMIATRQGSAAAELIEASRDAGMLVVGSRGRGGFAGLLLGSVSRACAAHAHCPVLVVPQPRAPEGER
jgi:nucleotide-binding universal stress UspA family protein